MSSNILGLNNIINKDKINSSIHLKDKEIDMLSNLSFDMNQTNDNNNNNNNNNLYDKDIKDIANEIGINLDNLDIRVTNIAKMLGAEYVILLDRESEVTGSMTNYYSTTSASYNTYTVSRKALAGVYSKVYAGFFVEKDVLMTFS